MRVYVDMDGVLCDFYGASRRALERNPKQHYPQSQWGFFLSLEPIAGAVESMSLLQQRHDVWILTRPSFMNVNCYTEKAQWVWDHLGYEMLKKTIIAGDKSLLKGDVLIDDQDNANQTNFEGEWLHFGSQRFPDWSSILNHLA